MRISGFKLLHQKLTLSNFIFQKDAQVPHQLPNLP